MNELLRRACMIAPLALASMLGHAATARAADLVYHGGPVLKSFTIVPYYYGPWVPSDITTHQNYLVGLAQYMSGVNAPATDAQPMLVQYGTTFNTGTGPQSVSVANPVIKSVPLPISLDTNGALAVIHDAQNTGTLLPYASDRVILLLLPHGAVLTVHCAYHGAEGIGKYYAFVTQDCSPYLQVTSHEVFEAATDPAIGFSQGWDECVDPCSTSVTLWFGPVPVAYDNLTHGCATAAYDPLQVLYVDAANMGLEDGTQAHPYRTVAGAIAVVGFGATISIKGATYLEAPLQFSARGLVTATNGPAVIR